MLRWSLFGSLFAVLLTLGACATPASETPPSGRDCFASRSILGYSIIDEHSVKVHVGASRDYIFSTTWNARDLNWSEAIVLRSTTGWICTGNGLGVEVTGGRPRRTYPITNIERAPEPAPQGS
ncbi:MAG: hypothetical protein JSS00_13330 [Proteobacteria bacterium]|nr:hypothetical protein [Pseudomonadota bacterium]